MTGQQAYRLTEPELRERITGYLNETGGNTWAAAEACVDSDVAAGEYEGCSTDLGLAFERYEGTAERVLEELTAP